MGREVIEGFLLTSEVIPLYGRAVLTEDDVRHIFEGYRDQPLAMLLDHNDLTPSTARVLASELRRTDQGDLGIYIQVEVDPDEVGERFGFSIGFSQRRFGAGEEGSRPIVELSADAYHFTEGDLTSAADVLRTEFRVGGGLYYQFQEIPPASIVLVFLVETIRAIPSNVLADLLVQALGRFTRNRSDGEPTTFKFRLRRGTRKDREELVGLVRTNDPEMLRIAGRTLRDLINERHGTYLHDGTRWRPRTVVVEELASLASDGETTEDPEEATDATEPHPRARGE